MNVLVLDTNIFMHCQPLDQIDWLNVVRAQEVKLLIPRVVMAELDKHKNQHPFPNSVTAPEKG